MVVQNTSIVRGLACELKYFYWIKNSVHLKDFQWASNLWGGGDCIIGGMTSATRVVHYKFVHMNYKNQCSLGLCTQAMNTFQIGKT